MSSEYMYRYEDYTGDESVYIKLLKFKILRHTPAGCWIEMGYRKEKFQLAGTRKKWACESTKIAAESFIARKEKQIRILKSQLCRTQASLVFAYERQKSGQLLEGFSVTLKLL